MNAKVIKFALVSLLLTGVVLGSLDSTLAQEEEIPPLYFFYVNHTHVGQDFAPYTNPALQQLDTEVADNMLDTIEAIAARLNTYGIKASWEVVYGTAQGLCEYEGQNHIFNQLLESGHEIGLHVHNHDDFERDYVAVKESCSIDPTVTSGMRLTSADRPPAVGARIAADAIATNVEFGISVGTTNFTDTRFMEACGEAAAANQGRDELSLTIFPWRVDWENAQFCEDDASSNFVIVEHIQMNPWTGGSNANQPDLLTPEHFENLKAYFDQALAYMETERPTRIAAWGFVTHPHEFMLGLDGENGPDADAIGALDEFLSYVADQEAAGRVIFRTASEIAQLLYEE